MGAVFRIFFIPLLVLRTVKGFAITTKQIETRTLSRQEEGFLKRDRTPTLSWVSSVPLWSPSRIWSAFNTYFEDIPVREGTVLVTRSSETQDNNTKEGYHISYALVRPDDLSSQQHNERAPIVVLHGGPSLPSEYCFPLAEHIPHRSILFYDQLGCGKSDEPSNLNYYSMEQSLDDLETILEKLSIRRFHLYGHSYGGMLAYEYLKRSAERKTNDGVSTTCLSVVLSSPPNDIQRMDVDWEALTEQLPSPDLFRETHICRTPEIPLPLQNAYDHAGTVWFGTDVIADYKAQPSSYVLSNALILRGEYDFVTEESFKKWKLELLCKSTVREHTLEGCSHHGLLENGPVYGALIESFVAEHD